MAPPAAPPARGGSILKRPLMGLPLYVWIGVAVVGLGVGIFLRRKSGAGAGAGMDYSLVPLNTGTDNGSITDGIAGGGIAQAPTGFDPQMIQDLLSRITSGSDALASQAGDARDRAYDYAQQALDTNSALVMNMGSSAGSGASSAGKAVPAAVAATKPVAKNSSTAAKAKPAPKIKYVTLKKNVKLGKGQTLHFTKGKGYYAA